MATFTSVFLPDTPVRLIATPATTYTVVSHKIVDGADIYVCLSGEDIQTDVDGKLLEPNPGAVPENDFPWAPLEN